MKKYLSIIVLIFIGFTSQSQVLISLLLGDKLNSDGLEFGLEGGMNFSNISGFENDKSLASFNLGFYFDIRMKNQWYFYTGVQVKSTLGMNDLSDNDLDFLQADMYSIEGDYKQKINAFMVPLLAKYKFKNHFYVEAGPQVGWQYKGWVEYTSKENNKEARIKDYNDDLVNWFNGGIAGGFGYKLRKGEGITIGVRYYQGLVDVFKDRSGTKSNSLNLKVNIPIGAAKAKE